MRHEDAPPPSADSSPASSEDDSGSQGAATEYFSSSASLSHDGLVRSETHRLRRLAGYLLASEHDREDLVQDVWLQALKRPPKERGKLSAWLRVVTNHAAQRLGRRFRSRLARERMAAKPEQLPSVLDALERESASGELRRWVDGLKPPYRDVLRLHFFEDCSIREISERLRRPEATVRSHLKRGLDLLRARHDGARPRGRPLARKRLRLWIPWLAPAEESSLDLARRHTKLFRLATFAAGLVVATLTLVRLAGRSSDAGLALDSPSSGPVSDGAPRFAALDLAPKEPRTAAREIDGQVGAGSAPESGLDGVPPGDSSALAGSQRFVVSGRTVDVLGTPVADAEIWASPGSDTAEARLVARSGSGGRYTVSDAAGDLWIWAEELDNGLTVRHRVSDPGTGETVDRELMFHANGGRLQGVVRDPSGSPVAGALVRAGLQMGDGARLGAQGEERLSLACAPRVTDARGRFEISRIQTPGLTVLATAEGHAPCALLIECKCREELTIELPVPAVLEARVRWPDGSPAEAVRVTLEHPWPLPGSSVETDAQGTVRFAEVPPGPFTLIGSGPRDGEILSFVERGSVQPGERLEWDPVLLSDAWTIRGTARSGPGALADWTVTLEEGSNLGEVLVQSTRTSSDGRFAFAGCAGENYTLRLYPPGSSSGMSHARVPDVRPGGSDVVLAPSEGSVPSAFVRGTLSRVGLPAGYNSIVTANATKGPGVWHGPIETEVDRSSGRFDLGPLPPGSYGVEVTHPALGTWKICDVDLGSGAAIDLGEVFAPRTGTLLVRWSSAGPEPGSFSFALRGQGIVLVGWRGFPGRRAEIDMAARTLLLRDLLPGDYSLLLQGVRLARVSKEALVLEDEQTVLDVALRQGGPVEVRVTAPRSLLVGEHVFVQIDSLEGTETFTVGDPNVGNLSGYVLQFRLILAAGKHRIEVRTSGGLVGARELLASGHGPAKHVTVALE